MIGRIDLSCSGCNRISVFADCICWDHCADHWRCCQFCKQNWNWSL